MKSLSLLVLVLWCLQIITGCAVDNRDKKETNEPDIEQDKLVQISEQLQKDSLNAALYHEKARLLLERNKINEALGDLRRAIEIDPDRSELFITLADAYLAMGKLPNCLESLQKAEKLDPANNEALLKMAEVYLILQDYQNTFNYVKKSLDLDTRNPRAYFIRGYALMEMGDTAAAIRNMQNALDHDQQYYEAAVQLGMLYSVKKNPLAEQYFKVAMGIDPGRDAAYYLLALFYQDMERMEEAIETYDKLLVISPGFKEAYYNLGYIYLVHYQDFKRAAEYFSDAIRQDPRYLDAWFNRGYCYELTGDYPNARKDYTKSLEIMPNYDRAVDGLNRLDKVQYGN